MIASITISGAGPIEQGRYDLDPQGVTHIRGPSESGKTTMLNLVCFVLWGTDRDGKPFPVECVREGSKRASVELTLKTGSTISRTLDPRRNQMRALQKRGMAAPQVFGSEETMREALGVLGDQRNRYIVVPFAWQALAEGPGGGRGLRDLLAGLVEGGSGAIVRELMGAAYRDGDDLVSEQLAVANRRGTKRDHEQHTGRLASIRERVSSLGRRIEELVAPAPEDLEQAQAVMQAAKAWSEHGARAKAWEQTEGRRSESARLAELWTTERDKLAAEEPPNPVDLLGQVREWEEAHATEQAEQRRLDAQAHAEQRLLAEEKAALASCEEKVAGIDQVPCKGMELRHVKLGTVECGKCKYLVDAYAAALRLEDLRVSVKRICLDVQTAETKAATVAGKVAESARKLSEARARMDEATSRRQAWEKRMRELGAAPSAPAAHPEPEAPTIPRPTEEAQRQAAATLAQADGVARDRRMLGQELTLERGNLTRAEETGARLERDVAHDEALVDALRRAPTLLAERGLALLGDLGPVSVRFDDDKGGSRVLVDGRDAREPLVSRGRLTYADSLLRAGLRRALRRLWLPVWVDNAQDWSGAFDIEGPAVLCWTMSEAMRMEVVR